MISDPALSPASGSFIGELRSRWRTVCLAPLIGSCVVIFTSCYFMWALNIGGQLGHPPMVPDAVTDLELVVPELRARVLWAVAAVTLASALTWTVTVSVLMAKRHAALASFLAIWIVGLALAILFLKTFGQSIFLQFVDPLIPSRLTAINVAIEVLNTLAAIGAGCVIAAACVLGSPLQTFRPDRLAARLRETRLLLFSSCVFLTAGVAEIYFLYSWPASFAVEIDRQFMLHLAATVALLFGCMFTLLLLGIFVPLSLVQAGWITKAVEDAPKPSDWDPEKWLKKTGLDIGPMVLLGRGVAMLVPTLAGLLPKFLEKLG